MKLIGGVVSLPVGAVYQRRVTQISKLSGIAWTKKKEVVPYQPEWRHSFDSPNVSFWSPAEQKYVCYFRTWRNNARWITRTTSENFIDWTSPVDMEFGDHVAEGMTVYWFTVLIAINLQTSFLTPPFGFALFYLKGIAPKEIKIESIYLGIIPFVFLQLIALIVVIVFPPLALWLPGVVYN